MPKEKTYDVAGTYDVTVAWEAGKHVQLGVCTHDGVPLERILNTPGGDEQEQAAVYDGVWSTLDRQAINRLIRSLRRARDAAFGRDE